MGYLNCAFGSGTSALDTYIGRDGSGNMIFKTGSTERVRVSSSSAQFIFNGSSSTQYIGKVNSSDIGIMSKASTFLRIGSDDGIYMWGQNAGSTNMETSSSTNYNLSVTGGGVGIGTTSSTGTAYSPYALVVYGNALAQGGTWTASDVRYKNNITGIDSALIKLKKLNGKIYEYDTIAYPHMGFNKGKNLGFIAQDVQQIFPQSVNIDSKGFYNMNYSALIPVLVEAIKTQDKRIDSLKQAIATCCNKATQRTTSTNIQTTGISSSAGENGTTAMLYQNTPNPFTQTTIVKCFIPDAGKTANLMVFDLNGSLKKSFSINEKGTVNITINGNQLVSGMYYYTLLIDGQEIDTKKMILTE